MEIRGRLLLAIIVVCILVSVILPGVKAEIFDIGKELESDINSADYYSFESGVVIQYGYNNISKILDGNLSTGIDEVWPGFDSRWVRVYFHGDIFVNNITYLPSFGGKSSNYDSEISHENSLLIGINNENSERTLNLNCSISSFTFRIYENGTDHFYFNDIIINYDPRLSNWSEIQVEFSDLNQQIDNLRSQINNLNNTIITLSQNQIKILDNMTLLQSNYNQLDNSLMNLFNEIENLNITTNENITLLQNDLNSIHNNINDIYQSITDLSNNVTELSIIQGLIDQTILDIQYLNKNITEVRNKMPSEYNDTALTTKIFQLETENAALSNDIQNLTEEIENLKDEPDDFMPLGGFVFGLLGILIAIVAVVLATRKSQPEKPLEENGESEGE